MTESKKKFQVIIFLMGVFLFILGIYNSFVINSDSSISNSQNMFVKRIDELYGINVPGKIITTSWEKTSTRTVSSSHSSKNSSIRPLRVVSSPVHSSANTALEEDDKETVGEAAVQEDLDLSLVEVINPRKWSNGLKNSDFSGNLVASRGVIEGLSVSLPGVSSLYVSGRELIGNVFEYDIDGELYSGMMYQVDENAYMITLTNGPLEGTRLRFSGQGGSSEEPSQNAIIENNIQVGSFGNNQIVENTSEIDHQEVVSDQTQNEQGSQREVATTAE